eukprot:6209471-Pleurochrysis_carterae.AAC.1
MGGLKGRNGSEGQQERSMAAAGMSGRQASVRARGRRDSLRVWAWSSCTKRDGLGWGQGWLDLG